MNRFAMLSKRGPHLWSSFLMSLQIGLVEIVDDSIDNLTKSA